MGLKGDMKKISSSLTMTLQTICIALLLGSAGGVLATALTTNYLASYAIQLGEYTTPLRLSDERPRAVPQFLSQALEGVEEQVIPSVVVFYLPSSIGYLREEDRVSRGVVLTTDGWILTMDQPGIAEEYLQAEVQQEFYEIERTVRDEATGALFVKISADHLPVVPFGSGWDAQSGDQVFVTPATKEVIETSVFTILHTETQLHSSESLSRRLVLQESIVENEVGSPVANIAGECIGIIDGVEESGKEYATVIPLNVFTDAFTRLLQTGEWTRAFLGVQSVDIAQTKGLLEETTRGYHAGAVLTGNGSIMYGSPASKAGLKQGDILLAVDGQVIDAFFSLDERLVHYAPGDIVILSLDRDGEKIEISVTLGEK
ncbi:TPA: hypothetical protein DEP34_02550 [Candidatus Uhrbacteria bacterium]|uniref:PDZ/DHR/GLGF domain protein n=2 Tax=Candidatus Uhriibacteriota TaxID=1752732 RepID=A0A0G1T4Q7_9BACT|nr:MAG: PDZ/DHR/GLGF domain protein [Candidatus Uhrbacteria bacterium GW2011_GWF2_46_218]KKU40410.1 MAG: PDZ/DHR/GLGF domain protein [Candidatus Uhrbacteria bacterium GW2011_GWE2_46_68]HBK33894.1 hypothetical protein [Candidatus Uhrbacteria bacterium]HCB19243.1 hypothetical protein [Candidatus Uhrbacteria bacterium]